MSHSCHLQTSLLGSTCYSRYILGMNYLKSWICLAQKSLFLFYYSCHRKNSLWAKAFSAKANKELPLGGETGHLCGKGHWQPSSPFPSQPTESPLLFAIKVAFLSSTFRAHLLQGFPSQEPFLLGCLLPGIVLFSRPTTTSTQENTLFFIWPSPQSSFSPMLLVPYFASLFSSWA